MKNRIVALPMAVRVTLLVLVVVVLFGLGRIAIWRNVEAACESNEWPHLSACPAAKQSVAEQVGDLSRRANRNPGDSTSYLALFVLAHQHGDVAPIKRDELLVAVKLLAGNSPLFLKILATKAVQGEKWDEAVQLLGRLAMQYRDEVALKMMASLVMVPEARVALVGALQGGGLWLPHLLRTLPEVNVPAVQAMPLVESGMSLGLLKPDLVLDVVGQLKRAGNWLEAQALWVRLLGRRVPVLFNGGFEAGFVPGGFDWEVQNGSPNRTGVRIAQPTMLGAQGRVLELTFNGRPLVVPLISQHVVLFPGSYTFSGRYMTRRLRAGAGLTWVFACTTGQGTR